jgi:predicted nucleic acid-binding protein
MVLVDSSVWVDYFNGHKTRATDHLDFLLSTEPVAIGDLTLAEVLQGFRKDADYKTPKQLLTGLTIYGLLGLERAILAADYYRTLRKQGITVWKTSDVVIATFCIQRKVPLLFSDKGFEPFVAHLGLKAAIGGA